MTEEYIFEEEIYGKTVTIETGKLARQSHGAVTIRCGDTIVLVTAVSAKEPREGIDFLPLTIDVEERMYAAGKIPGGFIKREGRPSEKSILTARLIDRPLRPCFPKGFTNNTQVVSTILSVDHVNPFDVLALNGASAALTISDIPFDGPIGAVRVAYANGNWIINPSFDELENRSLDLVVAANKKAILMVEAEAQEVGEVEIMEALKQAKEAIFKLIDFQERIQKQVGKNKREISLAKVDPDLEKKVLKYSVPLMEKALEGREKEAQDQKVTEVKEKIIEEFVPKSETLEENESLVRDLKIISNQLERNLVRKQILEGTRPDGRKPEDIRSITCEAGFLPRTRTHGSGLFTRGQTQVLTVLTLGTVGEEQLLDGLGLEESKRYLHHYNFPPFSTGETWPLRGPKRREIGHGFLVERALLPVIPDENEFPYTIRLVSDVLESNGSTSMASVCGSTLALMDAGVPIKAPVTGIAMGLIKEDDKTVILSDIQGLEDHLGDMDFKVAGTEKGITALQMDMKIEGIDERILGKALEQAKKDRLFILEKIREVIAKPREELSEFAPRVITLKIDPKKIGGVIGPGGKVIRGIIDETGATIDIEDDGTVFISSKEGKGGEEARKMVEMITREVKVGDKYVGTVTKITNFGAFVEILPGREGLIHISRLSKGYVRRVEDVVKPGDRIPVKVIEIDRQNKINLSALDSGLQEVKGGGKQ